MEKKLLKTLTFLLIGAGVGMLGYCVGTRSNSSVGTVVRALLFGSEAGAFARTDNDFETPLLTPWESVGGCGAGGSGGGGGGAKWVGMGVSGGLIDLQLMKSVSFGQNFFNSTTNLRLSGKPTWTSGLGLSIPVTSKIGEVQPVSIEVPRYYITGGMGDISADWSKSFGMEGQYSLGVGLTLPTGQYDIKRGPDSKSEFLPSGLQKGGGLYNASLTLSYTKDVEDGIWLFDLGYSHPFNMKLFTGKNQFMDDYYSNYKNYADSSDSDIKNRFYYRFKPYGENDLGDYTPPSVNVSAYYGYKGVHGYMHSWGVTFSAPLAIAWVHAEPLAADQTKTMYNPRPDPDHESWSATLNYGLEFGNDKFPLFLAVSLPLHDRSNDPEDPKKTFGWDAPDWEDFGQQWTFAIGMKATMF